MNDAQSGSFRAESAAPAEQGIALLDYSYAVFNSSAYRQRYDEFLRIGFPRVPTTTKRQLFDALARKGGELVGLHLMVSAKAAAGVAYAGVNAPVVRRAAWSNDAVWLDGVAASPLQSEGARSRSGFQGVGEVVWNFHIGGYQVCEKWLKDRRGRTLTPEDVEHYKRIIGAIEETIRIQKEIDEVIEAHGGWPAAFAGGAAGEAAE